MNLTSLRQHNLQYIKKNYLEYFRRKSYFFTKFTLYCLGAFIRKWIMMFRDYAPWSQFHQHVYAQLFCAKDKKAACFWKLISPCFSVWKLCWLCHLQVALSCAGCHSQVTISFAQKGFEKAAHKNVDEIDFWKGLHKILMIVFWL